MTQPKVISRTSTQEEIASDYKWGFVTDIEADIAPKGLNEDVVRMISAKKGEPEWMTEWRLKAYRFWISEDYKEPRWAKVSFPPIDYQDIHYYSAPKKKEKGPKSLDEVDPELVEAFNKLGIPLAEQKALTGVAVDAVFDSVSVATTFQKQLEDLGIIFCPISEAIQEHPELVRKYLGSVVPYSDNFYATLNSAVFSDGTFCLRASGRALPGRADDLLPDELRRDGAVRADANHRRQGELRELPRGLHGADAKDDTSCTRRSSS